MLKSLHRSTLYYFVLLIIVSYLPLFHNLTKAPISMWDEAIYANNALEMSRNHNPLILFNNGAPTLYNTKPPFVIWLQAICLSILGPNELAIRLPSAMAGLLTVLILFFFLCKLFNERLAFFTSIILVSSFGFIRSHVTRSGDLDALMTFFTTTYSLYFIYLGTTMKKIGFISLLIFFTLVYLSFLTKSIQGLIPLGGVILVGLIFKRAYLFDNFKQVLIAFVGLILFIIGYYALRECIAPGYIDKVIQSEFFRFSSNITGEENQSFWYYLIQMKNRFYDYWIWFLLLSVIILFFKDEQKRRLYTSLAIIVVSYFLIISFSTIKREWYDAPLYPFLAILIGITLYPRIEYFTLLSKLNGNIHFTCILFSILICIYPYLSIIKHHSNTLPDSPWDQMGYGIRELSISNPEIKKYKCILDIEDAEISDQPKFYAKSLNWYKGFDIKIVTELSDINEGESTFVWQAHIIKQIESHTEYELIKKIHQCYLYSIKCKNE